MRQIEVNGKLYPCKFSNGAIMRFCENHDPKMDLPDFFNWLEKFQSQDFGDFEIMREISSLTYYAIQVGCLYEDVDFDIHPVMITDKLLDEGYTKKIVEALVESLPKEDNSKKK